MVLLIIRLHRSYFTAAKIWIFHINHTYWCQPNESVPASFIFFNKSQISDVPCLYRMKPVYFPLFLLVQHIDKVSPDNRVGSYTRILDRFGDFAIPWLRLRTHYVNMKWFRPNISAANCRKCPVLNLTQPNCIRCACAPLILFLLINNAAPVHSAC